MAFFGKKRFSGSGESYGQIMGYFLPELVTAIVVYSLLSLFDAKMIANLSKTSFYAVQGVTTTLVQFFTKVAEGLIVGTVVLCGQYNGRKQFRKAGISAVSSFWLAFLVGVVVSAALYFGAPKIYAWYGLPKHMIRVGVPFLRVRAIGIFFMFLYFSFIGFLRSIKNTRVPMVLFVIGALTFIFFDWALINGRCGFAFHSIQGSSFAFLIQHLVMCLGAIFYFILSKDVRRYGMHVFKSYKLKSVFGVLKLSWPVMLDKAAIAWSKLQLVPLLGSAGWWALPTYTAIRDMHVLIHVPAFALAQVLTFLISNNVGAGNWRAVRGNIKKIFVLSFIFMFSVLVFFIAYSRNVIALFDRQGDFTVIASKAFLLVSFFIMFDLLQIVFSAALRGMGEVKVVMLTRLIAAVFFFYPVSKFLSTLPVSGLMKFMLIFASFYIINGISSLVFVYRIYGKKLRKKAPRRS